MKILMHILEMVWQALLVAGVITGIIAWRRRDFRIPRQIHRLSLCLFVIGALVALGAYAAQVRSLSFTLLVLLGLPLSAYVGWVVAGCPPNEPKSGGRMDISGVGSDRYK